MEPGAARPQQRPHYWSTPDQYSEYTASPLERIIFRPDTLATNHTFNKLLVGGLSVGLGLLTGGILHLIAGGFSLGRYILKRHAFKQLNTGGNIGQVARDTLHTSPSLEDAIDILLKKQKLTAKDITPYGDLLCTLDNKKHLQNILKNEQLGKKLRDLIAKDKDNVLENLKKNFAEIDSAAATSDAAPPADATIEPTPSSLPPTIPLIKIPRDAPKKFPASPFPFHPFSLNLEPTVLSYDGSAPATPTPSSSLSTPPLPSSTSSSSIILPLQDARQVLFEATTSVASTEEKSLEQLTQEFSAVQKQIEEQFTNLNPFQGINFQSPVLEELKTPKPTKAPPPATQAPSDAIKKKITDLHTQLNRLPLTSDLKTLIPYLKTLNTDLAKPDCKISAQREASLTSFTETLTQKITEESSLSSPWKPLSQADLAKEKPLDATGFAGSDEGKHEYKLLELQNTIGEKRLEAELNQNIDLLNLLDQLSASLAQLEMICPYRSRATEHSGLRNIFTAFAQTAESILNLNPTAFTSHSLPPTHISSSPAYASRWGIEPSKNQVTKNFDTPLKATGNQDAACVITNPKQQYTLGIVCDGHGPVIKNTNNHEIQASVARELSWSIAHEDLSDDKKITQAFKNAYQEAENAEFIKRSNEQSDHLMGTTATTALIKNNRIHTACVADARVIKVKRSGTGYNTQQLTKDQSPLMDFERIETNNMFLAGGGSSPLRLGRLNVSGGIGDFDMKGVEQGKFENLEHLTVNSITSQPNIAHYAIEPDDTCVLVMSDGVFDLVKLLELCSPKDVNAYIGTAIQQYMDQGLSPKGAADLFLLTLEKGFLKKQASDPKKLVGKMDDMTLVVLPLNNAPGARTTSSSSSTSSSQSVSEPSTSATVAPPQQIDERAVGMLSEKLLAAYNEGIGWQLFAPEAGKKIDPSSVEAKVDQTVLFDNKGTMKLHLSILPEDMPKALPLLARFCCRPDSPRLGFKMTPASALKTFHQPGKEIALFFDAKDEENTKSIQKALSELWAMFHDAEIRPEPGVVTKEIIQAKIHSFDIDPNKSIEEKLNFLKHFLPHDNWSRCAVDKAIPTPDPAYQYFNYRIETWLNEPHYTQWQTNFVTGENLENAHNPGNKTDYFAGIAIQDTANQ